jgi:hypothetical protein
MHIILAFFLAWEIYDIYPFINLSQDDVVIPFVSLLDYFSFNLIIRHISIFGNFGITKITKKKKHGVPSPPFFKVLYTILQNNYSCTH